MNTFRIGGSHVPKLSVKSWVSSRSRFGPPSLVFFGSAKSKSSMGFAGGIDSTLHLSDTLVSALLKRKDIRDMFLSEGKGPRLSITSSLAL